MFALVVDFPHPVFVSTARLFVRTTEPPHRVLAGLRGSYFSDSGQETGLGTIR